MHMRTLIGHWLQGNLHAEHFLLVTRPTVSLFFCSSERNWKAGPCAGASNDKFSMKCRRLPDSSSYKSRSYVWEGTAWKTRVAGSRRVDNTKLLQPLSCPPNQPQNALREHQLALSGYNALLCNALLWASTKYDHSCIILHAMRHLSVGSIRNQVSLGRRCWGWKALQRTSLNGSRPCSRAWKAGLCIL